MTFWAIEARPGELQVDDVPVNEAVSRILEITTAGPCPCSPPGWPWTFSWKAFCLTRSEELEAAFEHELRMAGATGVGADLRFPVFAPESLIGVMETESLDVQYVALDPDTPSSRSRELL